VIKPVDNHVDCLYLTVRRFERDEAFFVQKEAFVAGKKFLPATLITTQQQFDIVVPASLFDLYVNLRPDF